MRGTLTLSQQTSYLNPCLSHWITMAWPGRTIQATTKTKLCLSNPRNARCRLICTKIAASPRTLGTSSSTSPHSPLHGPPHTDRWHHREQNHRSQAKLTPISTDHIALQAIYIQITPLMLYTQWIQLQGISNDSEIRDKERPSHLHLEDLIEETSP